MAMTEAQAKSWATGYLKYIGAPATGANDPRVAFLTAQAMHEGTAAKNNPLAIEAGGGDGLPGNEAVSQYATTEDGYKALSDYMTSNSPDYLTALRTSNTTTASLTTALAGAEWEGSATPAAKTASASYADAVGSAAGGTTTGEPGAVTIPSQPADKPIAGADVKNFYGYDLSAWSGSPVLGTMENAIKNYVEDPGYAKQVQQKLETEYGYQTNWWKSIPEVNAVMIYAATSLDPSNATQQNEFQSLLANTNWWQTTTSNGRYWDEAYGTDGSSGTDPAQAQQALQNAQEKVLADANQIGVSLSKQQLDAIALTYAKNNYVASGSFGTASGTAAEWLDQAIVDTLENIQGQNVGKIPTDFSTLAPGTSDFSSVAVPSGSSTSPTAVPTGLTGIAAQLYASFQNIAQQYLMYNPSNPAGSLLTNQSLMQQVESTLQNYTGSGSSFGSSNLISGAEAKFTVEMQQQASQMYPSMASAILGGTTPQAYVQPYQSVISSMTGIDPASINFTDPQWNWVIATPNAQGQKTALTLDQVQQKLATTPQFDQSNNAQGMADSVTSNLSAAFGFGAK
jgi:hypothetical protein